MGKYIILEGTEPYSNPKAFGPFSEEEFEKILVKRGYWKKSPTATPWQAQSTRSFEKPDAGGTVTITWIPWFPAEEMA